MFGQAGGRGRYRQGHLAPRYPLEACQSPSSSLRGAQRGHQLGRLGARAAGVRNRFLVLGVLWNQRAVRRRTAIFQPTAGKPSGRPGRRSAGSPRKGGSTQSLGVVSQRPSELDSTVSSTMLDPVRHEARQRARQGDHPPRRALRRAARSPSCPRSPTARRLHSARRSTPMRMKFADISGRQDDRRVANAGERDAEPIDLRPYFGATARGGRLAERRPGSRGLCETKYQSRIRPNLVAPIGHLQSARMNAIYAGRLPSSRGGSSSGGDHDPHRRSLKPSRRGEVTNGGRPGDRRSRALD